MRGGATRDGAGHAAASELTTKGLRRCAATGETGGADPRDRECAIACCGERATRDRESWNNCAHIVPPPALPVARLDGRLFDKGVYKSLDKALCLHRPRIQNLFDWQVNSEEETKCYRRGAQRAQAPEATRNQGLLTPPGVASRMPKCLRTRRPERL